MVVAADVAEVDSDSCEVTRYLGQNSIPALLKEQTSPNAEEEGIEVIRHDMRSIFGLDNSAPFPLMSATHLDRLTKDVASELPADREVMKCVSVALWLGPSRRLRGLECHIPKSALLFFRRPAH